MSTTPEFTSTMRSEYCSTRMTDSNTYTEVKPRETARRVIAGIGMITPVAAFIALTVWYVAL